MSAYIPRHQESDNVSLFLNAIVLRGITEILSLRIGCTTNLCRSKPRRCESCLQIELLCRIPGGRKRTKIFICLWLCLEISHFDIKVSTSLTDDRLCFCLSLEWQPEFIIFECCMEYNTHQSISCREIGSSLDAHETACVQLEWHLGKIYNLKNLQELFVLKRRMKWRISSKTDGLISSKDDWWEGENRIRKLCRFMSRWRDDKKFFQSGWSEIPSLIESHYTS
jgi:hypothetical protein